MTFPQDILDLHVRLYYSGAWNDITSDVRGMSAPDGRINITRGQQDEASGLRASQCRLAFNNRNGTYSPRNPNSSLFGLIGRNTPLQAHIGTPHVADTNVDTVDTTSMVAPSVDSPTADAVLLCAWAAPASVTWTLPGSMTAGNGAFSSDGSIDSGYEAISAAGATGTRTATADVSEDYLAASVLLHGTSPTVGTTVGDSDGEIPITSSAGEWWVVISYFGWGDPTGADQPNIPVPDYPNDTDGGGWILLADSGRVNAGDTQADYFRMKAWAKRVKTSGDHTVFVDDPSGNLTMRSVLFEVADVGDFDIRFTGEVAAWPQRWDISGNDVWVPIQVSGLTRRLSRVESTPLDAIHRFTTIGDGVTGLVGYWPMDDPDGSRAASAVVGSSAVPTGLDRLDFGNGGFHPATPNGIATKDSGSIKGTCIDATESGITAAYLYRPTRGSSGQVMRTALTIQDLGGDTAADAVDYRVVLDPSSDDIVLETRSWTDSLIDSGTFSPGNVYNGGTKTIHLRVEDASGNNVTFTLWVDGVQAATDTLNAGKSSAPMPNTARLSWNASAGFDQPAHLGQLAVWQGTTLTAAQVHNAWNQYRGDRPSVRIGRLCREEGVPFSLVGDSDDEETLLGPQHPRAFFELLDEAVVTGGGWLYEPREFRGLAYRTVGSAYNRTAVLALDYDDAPLGQAPEPTEDDRYTANDVTVERPEGGRARSIQSTGPLNVSDPADDPQGVGRYRVQVRASTVRVVPVSRNLAGWLRHRGTVDQPRWPDVDLHQTNSAWTDALRQDARALDVGDRWTLDNPPAWLPPEIISQLAVGFAETLSQYESDIRLNNVPEEPFHIPELAHADYGFVQSDAASAAEALDTTETGVDINAGGGPDWDYEADFDIMIGGERMTVTAVAAMAGTFPNRTTTLTVTRSVNGVVKSHSSGTSVEFIPKTYIGL